eukprot:Phypoly_transcript_23367.p1 GENE.Phypoly_transcript_23367~~Phypoly_transcript_23367.p1  ORF type:complete len:155 (+),score=28.66 Phypoly_transcript_23367:98-562(+)
MPNTFLMCVDESLASDEAFKHVAPLVHPGDKLIFLHVIEPIITQPIIAFPPLQVTPIITHDVSNLDEQKAKSARLKLKYSTLCQDKQIFCEWLEEIGNPTERIKHVVDEIHPTLLVLGSNNKNILERAFLGSVSRHFATHAECPVLIVPQHVGK